MNFIYAWAIERVEKRDEWNAMLSAPLPGQEKAGPTPFESETEAADFMATMQMHQTRTAS
jgi:hypothetical protein